MSIKKFLCVLLCLAILCGCFPVAASAESTRAASGEKLSEEEVNKGRIRELTKLYVKYHEEAEKDPALDDEARRYFKLI